MATITAEQATIIAALQEVTTATYSAEDNKLRIRCTEWLDKETYAIIKSFGFV